MGDGLCRAGSLRAEGEQQAHLDAFIVLFRDIDDLITSLVEQIAATDVSKWKAGSRTIRIDGITHEFNSRAVHDKTPSSVETA